MKTTREAEVLRIHVGEEDMHGHVPLYEAIVRAAREHGMAGATVLRGVMGFGAHSVVHTAKILRLAEDLPLVIEIIDRADRIQSFLPVVDEMVTEGLVTIEKARVIAYREGEAE